MRRRHLLLLFVLGTLGCRHKAAPPIPLGARTPAPLEKAPEPANPPLVATVPLQQPPIPTTKIAARKVKRRKKTPPVVPAVAPPATPAPVQVAAATPAPGPADPVGELTVGGDLDPGQRQKVKEAIAANEKRLNRLDNAVLVANVDLVVQARNFDHEAQRALDSGDAEAATQLANKAKLLLDDLEK